MVASSSCVNCRAKRTLLAQVPAENSGIKVIVVFLGFTIVRKHKNWKLNEKAYNGYNKYHNRVDAFQILSEEGFLSNIYHEAGKQLMLVRICIGNTYYYLSVFPEIDYLILKL